MRAFLFPGQGSQSVGMGVALSEASRAARDVFEQVDEALGQNLFRLMRDGPDDELRLTENAQPAIMANSMAVFAALTREGGVDLAKAAQFVAGHSLGEYSALCAAGSFNLATTAKLLKLRGQAMQAAVPVGVGAMAALLGADLELAQKIADAAAQGEVCAVANDNDPGQVVLSGHKGAIDRAIELAKDMGAKRAVPLPVSAPFHCPLMQPAAEAMEDALSYVVRRGAGGAALRQCHRRAGYRSGYDPRAAGRAGHRHGPLAREHREDGRRGHRRVRRIGRQGARADGQAHRARCEGDQRRHDRGH